MDTRTYIRQTISPSTPPTKESESALATRTPKLEADGISFELSQSNLLGSGLFSVVFKGEDRDGKALAIKIFAPNLGPETTETDRLEFERTFWKEFDQLKDMKSIGLPKVHPVKLTFTSPDHTELHGYARELLEPLPIPPIEIDKTLTICEVVSETVEAIHDQTKLVVFDIAPDNILQRPNGEVVLADINLATEGKSFSTERTTGYTAPEVGALNSSGFDLSATTYALGKTIFALLGGSIDTDEFSELYGSELSKPNEMPDEVFEVIKKATADNPTERYQRPTEFAKALSEAIKK